MAGQQNSAGFMRLNKPKTEWASYENRMVLILSMSGAVAALDGQAVFYLMPFIAPALGLSDGEIGMIGTIVLIGAAFTGFIVARFSDRIGRRKPFLVGAFTLTALFSSMSAVSGSFLSLLVSRLILGMVEGPIIPIKQAIVMAESSPRRRGLNMGIVQNLGAQLIGTLAAPIFLIWLAQVWGWRSAFLVAGAPAILLAILIARYIREPAPLKRDDVALGTSGLRPVVGERNVLLSAGIGICAVGWFFILLTFLPLWLTRELGYGNGMMSMLVGTIGAAGAVSAIFVPGLSDRIGRKPVVMLFCLLGTIAPVGALVAGHHALAVGVSLLVGCLMTGTFPIFMAVIPQESVAPQSRATATAVVIATAQVAGGCAGPFLSGMLADQFGLQAALWLATALAAGAVLLAIGLRETRSRGSDQARG